VRRQERVGLRVDVSGLRMAIDVLASFSALAVGRQTLALARLDDVGLSLRE
jgi:hypothetical protein